MCNCKMCNWLKGLFGKKCCCEEKGCCEDKKVKTPVASTPEPLVPVQEEKKEEEKVEEKAE